MRLLHASLILCGSLLSSCVSESYAIHYPAGLERPMNSTDPAAIREAEYIRSRREAALVPMDLPYVGHAMSGGGLRSAVVNLGVLQGLAESKTDEHSGLSVLDRIDFMSAVSGGGYTAAWYVCHLDPVTEDILKMRQGQLGKDISSQVNPSLVETYSGNLAPHVRRKGIKVIGYDANGFKSSSSYNGDLLEANPMVNANLKEGGEWQSTEGIGFGYGIFHLRGNARHLGDTTWGLADPAVRLASRYPFHAVLDIGLHWTPADKFNWHHPVNIYSDDLGDIFTRSDVRHELSLRKAGETARSNPDTLRLREWPLPHHDEERIAIEDLNQTHSEAPVLILNCHLSNADYRWGDNQRQEAFEFTPFYSGSDEVGYVDTKALNMHVSKRIGNRIYGSHTFHALGFLPVAKRSKLSLADASAASGAALDGSAVNPVGDFFLRVVNLNLRYRLVNYNQESWGGECRSLIARTWNFLYEVSGGRIWNCEQSESSCLTLTDGGHFENLGVYALVRRQLPIITCVDASYDPTMRCDDLQNLLHILRREGYSVGLRPEGDGDQELLAGFSVDLDDTCGGPRLPLKRFIYKFDIVKGTYHGVLIVAKMNFTPETVASLPSDVAAMLTRYRQQEKDFPYLSTAALAFDAYQWEALRVFGRQIGLQLAKAASEEMSPSK